MSTMTTLPQSAFNLPHGVHPRDVDGGDAPEPETINLDSLPATAVVRGKLVVGDTCVTTRGDASTDLMDDRRRDGAVIVVCGHPGDRPEDTRWTAVQIAEMWNNAKAEAETKAALIKALGKAVDHAVDCEDAVGRELPPWFDAAVDALAKAKANRR